MAASASAWPTVREAVEQVAGGGVRAGQALSTTPTMMSSGRGHHRRSMMALAWRPELVPSATAREQVAGGDVGMP